MPTNFNIGGTDIDQIYVSRSYLMDRYPEIANTFKASGLYTWGKGSLGQLASNNSINRSSPDQTVTGGNNWKQVTSGMFTAGAIKTDGTMWLWGRNNYGQLGSGSLVSQSSPVQTIAAGTTWKQLSVGGNTNSAIREAGTLWTWGAGTALGDNTVVTKSSPVQTVAGGTNWKQVSSGGNNITAIKTDGTLWTWGANYKGQLGDNTNINVRSSPVQTVAGGTNWLLVSAGFTSTGAIKTNGTLWIWGNNNYGQLGDNSTINKSSPIQTVAGGSNWKQISVGYKNTAATKTDGSLWLWGRNSYGQLGDNTRIDRSSPIQTISGGTNWKQIYVTNEPFGVSFSTTVAIKTDGSLWTWGNNGYGQLGDGSQIYKSSPVQTSLGGYNWMQCSVGQGASYAIRDFSTDYLYTTTITPFYQVIAGVRNLAITNTTAFSANYFSGTVTYSVSPALPTGLSLDTSTGVISGTPTVAQSATNYTITGTGSLAGTANASVSISVTISGNLWGWGFNGYGDLGDNSTINKSSPVQTSNATSNWVVVSGGFGHTVAIKTDGTLWTWGRGQNGQLGNNGTISRSVPGQTVAGGTNWRSAAAGAWATVATKTDGTLWTWGYNATYGQLGDGTVINKSSPVQTISGGTNWSAVISAGVNNFAVAAIKTDGTLWTWGGNTSGQLGDNSITSRSSPVQTVAGGTNWTGIAIDSNATAIKSDGTLWTWGSNSTGQLGDNTTINKSSPVQTISGGTNWSQADTGNSFAAGIKTDGTLWTWGSNASGALGIFGGGNKLSPIQTVAGGTNWSQISCGNNSGQGWSAATKTDGTLWTWGYNFWGQLGDNSTITQSSPVQTIAAGTNWQQPIATGSSVFAIRYIV